MRRRSSSTMPSRSPSPGSACGSVVSVVSVVSLNRATADDDRLAPRAMTSVPSPRHLAAMSSLLIRCCSSTMPSSSASGRGGQPGT